MKTTASLSSNAKPSPRVKAADALEFIEQSGVSAPVPDARARLADFYKRDPLRTLKPGQRGIVESLKADRDRR